MRFRWMVCYWLAVAATGALLFWLPVAGIAFAIGALSYLGLSIPGWMVLAVFLANSEYRGTTFGIANRRLYPALAAAACIASIAGSLAGVTWLAYGAAGFMYLCGECLVMDRMLAWRDRHAAQAPALKAG